MGATAECQWSVHSCSSEAEVHEASNALKRELYRVWQTAQPADEAWLILEASPPSALSQMEIVNAGSALVEVFGLPDDNPHEDDPEFTMLLSPQQFMSTKDVISKANRNRSFTYDCSNKLSQLAAQHRWKHIKVICRQPFGSEEQKTCIGLSRLSFKVCKTSAEVAADAAEAQLQQKLKAGMAKMFSKASSSAEGEVISQVTEPLKRKIDQEAARSGEAGNLAPPSGKRKLPAWQSPSKHTKKEIKKADAGDGALSNEDGEEISDRVEVSHNKKSRPKASKPERKELVTLAGGKGRSSAVTIKEQDKEMNARRPKSPEARKNEGSPHQLSKGASAPSRKGSERGKREGSPRSGSKQHSKRQNTQSRDGSELSEGSPSPDQHQASPPTATLNQTESSKDPSGQAHSQAQKAHGRKGETQSRLSVGESSKGPLQSSSTMHEPEQASAIITLPFSKLLNGVVFAISGLVNPERAELRDKALEMGGQYRADWSADCTLLICSFANTPKFNQVKNDNGTIVSKVWIQECYKQKKLIEIEKYLMHVGKPWRQIEASAADERDDEIGLECDDSTTLGSLRDLQKWVHEDVAASMTWLQQQETQPEAAELKSVAIQGIQLCLDDTIECLKSKQSIRKIIESWDYVPRAVRELVGREEKAGSAKKNNFWSDMLSEAERLKWIYSKELEKMKRIEKLGEEKYGKQQKSADDEDDATDDASTDVMSDDMSSDNTQVLDEEEIREAEEALSKLLSGQHRK